MIKKPLFLLAMTLLFLSIGGRSVHAEGYEQEVGISFYGVYVPKTDPPAVTDPIKDPVKPTTPPSGVVKVTPGPGSGKQMLLPQTGSSLLPSVTYPLWGLLFLGASFISFRKNEKQKKRSRI